MNSPEYIKVMAGTAMLAIALAGCGEASNNISISTNAVSINKVTVSSSSISNNSISDNNIEGSDGVTAVADTPVEANYVKTTDAKIGDIIAFGTYEQDGDATSKEPLEWVVLDEYEDTILVLSRYVIASMPFNEEDKPIYWSQSTIRTWLNEDFIEEAFSESEQEHITESTLSNPGSSLYFSEFDKSGGTGTGNQTLDRVFLFSFSDVLKYFETTKVDEYYVYVSPELICEATVASGIENKSMSKEEYEVFLKDNDWPEECLDKKGAGWFLRSHGINSSDVMSVGYDGAMRGYYFQLGSDYETVTFEGGVRPAMWISR